MVAARPVLVRWKVVFEVHDFPTRAGRDRLFDCVGGRRHPALCGISSGSSNSSLRRPNWALTAG